MNTINTLSRFALITTLVMSMTSCKETKKEVVSTDATAPSTTLSYIENYLKMKDALVADDGATASTFAASFYTSLKEFDISSFSDENQNEITKTISMIAKHSSQINNTDIATQREHFEVLSVLMVDLVKITGTGSKLYVQYCPMYKSGQGGSWLSANKEVKNPLFGSMMLNCGMVTDEIN